MKINIILGISTIAFGLIACSGSEDKKESSAKDSTTEEQPRPEVSCSESNALTFTSENLDGSDFDVKFVHASIKEMTSGDQTYPAVYIILTDYDTGGSAYKSPKGDQRRVILMISGTAGEEMLPGEYPAFGASGFGADNASSFTIVTESDNLAMWGSGGTENTSGTTNITHIDEYHICGTMDLMDSKGTKLTASFSTELHK